MTFLALSILCSTLISFIFKSFDRYQINTFQAIVFNYFVCVLCAWVMLGDFPIRDQVWNAPYFKHGLFLGFIFITGFNAIGITVQRFGITIGAVLQKMSIIFSAAFAIWMYNEGVSIGKIIGIMAAVIAIWLVNIRSSSRPVLKKETVSKWLWLAPVYTLFSSALVEITLQYVELRLVEQSGDPFFVAFLFGTAGCLGLTAMIIGLLRGQLKWEKKNLLAGLILGIANYGSIYFLMRALGMGWEGSMVFPINNVAVISCSALGAYFLFKEKLSLINIAGLGLAVLAIVLIML